MKTVLIQYVLKDTASVEDVERAIRGFVGGIRELGVGIRYASHRAGDRAYAHIGYVPDDAALKALRAAPFFEPFGTFLREACEEAPRVTWLEVVASTETT